MTYRLIQHWHAAPDIVDTFDDPDDAMDAYKDAAWAYAHAPGVSEHGERVRSVKLYAPDGSIIRQWPRP